MERYKLVAIVGEAGSGKDSLARALADVLEKEGLKVHEVVSYTTRPPRDYETDGVDYHFVEPLKFADLIFKNRILEAAEFNDWIYGTCIDDLDPEAINIEVLNPDGVNAIYADHSTLHRIDMFVIQCVCSEKTRLIRQLEREENPNIDEIMRRLGTDRRDFAEFNIRDYAPWYFVVPTDGGPTPHDEAKLALAYLRCWTEKSN